MAPLCHCGGVGGQGGQVWGLEQQKHLPCLRGHVQSSNAQAETLKVVAGPSNDEAWSLGVVKGSRNHPEQSGQARRPSACHSSVATEPDPRSSKEHLRLWLQFQLWLWLLVPVVAPGSSLGSGSRLPVPGSGPGSRFRLLAPVPAPGSSSGSRVQLLGLAPCSRASPTPWAATRGCAGTAQGSCAPRGHGANCPVVGQEWARVRGLAEDTATGTEWPWPRGGGVGLVRCFSAPGRGGGQGTRLHKEPSTRSEKRAFSRLSFLPRDKTHRTRRTGSGPVPRWAETLPTTLPTWSWQQVPRRC